MNLCFTDQKRLRSESMNPFRQLPAFEKEFLRLSKKYRSLGEDLAKFERFVFENPTGVGKNFTIIHTDQDVTVVKARMMCRSLRDRSIRMIYAYHGNVITFVYLEVYFKGDKENEDRERIAEYIKTYKAQ